jgi:hypothetical protein
MPLMSSADGAETWAERLGYPAGQRVLILHANYAGAGHEFNEACESLLDKGLVQSAAVMPPCPWFEGFADWCREHPDLDIGICLTLNSPSEGYRWGPLAGESGASSLTDSEGYLWKTPLQVALEADAAEVQAEVTRQIEKARRAGIRPTHIAPFLGVLFTREDLLDVYLQTSKKYWIPAVMEELTPEKIARFRAEGHPMSDGMIQRIAQYPLPKLDELHFIPDGDSYEAKRDAFYKLVKELPSGLAQLIAGPASDTSGLRKITDDWQNRIWDRQLLEDPQVQEFLKAEGVLTTNWREVMRRFEAGLRPAAEAASVRE